jgi:hypothetical protein
LSKLQIYPENSQKEGKPMTQQDQPQNGQTPAGTTRFGARLVGNQQPQTPAAPVAPATVTPAPTPDTATPPADDGKVQQRQQKTPIDMSYLTKDDPLAEGVVWPPARSEAEYRAQMTRLFALLETARGERDGYIENNSTLNEQLSTAKEEAKTANEKLTAETERADNAERELAEYKREFEIDQQAMKLTLDATTQLQEQMTLAQQKLNQIANDMNARIVPDQPANS